jgi:hypothetical protein
MGPDGDSLQKLADACVALSANIRDANAASELRRIAYRLLQLADATLPDWEEESSEFGWRPA